MNMILLVSTDYLNNFKKYLKKFEIKYQKKNKINILDISTKISIGELAAIKICLSEILKFSLQKYPQYKDLILNNDKKIVKINREEIYLSKTEFDLLKFFIKNPNKILNRRILLKEVWNYSMIRTNTNTLGTHISTLRKKIAKAEAKLITFTGLGYMLQ